MLCHKQLNVLLTEYTEITAVYIARKTKTEQIPQYFEILIPNTEPT